jgi:hypothetical protein
MQAGEAQYDLTDFAKATGFSAICACPKNFPFFGVVFRIPEFLWKRSGQIIDAIRSEFGLSLAKVTDVSCALLRRNSYMSHRKKPKQVGR